jgi:hypothetical protein
MDKQSKLTIKRFAFSVNSNRMFVEDEQHFMMNCPLYSDIRFELTLNAKRLIVNFDCLSMEQKFISILKCNDSSS